MARPDPTRSARRPTASARRSRPRAAPTAATSTSPARWRPACGWCSARPAAVRWRSRSGPCRRTSPRSAATPRAGHARCSPSTASRRARPAAGLHRRPRSVHAQPVAPGPLLRAPRPREPAPDPRRVCTGSCPPWRRTRPPPEPRDASLTCLPAAELRPALPQPAARRGTRARAAVRFVRGPPGIHGRRPPLHCYIRVRSHPTHQGTGRRPHAAAAPPSEGGAREAMADPFKNTPPAPEDKGAMTAQNIAAALAGESQASQKYLAFADVADGRGLPERRAPLPRRRLRREHPRPQPPQRARRHRHHRREPQGGLGRRDLRDRRDVRRLRRRRQAAGEQVARRPASATPDRPRRTTRPSTTTSRKGVEGKQDCGTDAVRVCPICGHTVIGDAPDECPVCGTAGSYFKEF